MRWLWRNSELSGLQKCHRVRYGPNVDVYVDGDGGVWFGGFCRCHSVWACPMCAPQIRRGRALELGKALRQHLANDGGCLHSTYTLPHNVGDRLSPLFDAVAKSWHSVATDKVVRQLRGDLGLQFTRSTEVTHGVNGWHPHLHVGEVCPRPLTRDEVLEYRREAFRAWCSAVERHGYRPPSERYGLSMSRADAGMADYVSKVQGLADELLRLDQKSGKTDSPFTILRRAVGGDEKAHGVWVEYEMGTFGRKALTYSKGFKPLCAVGEAPVEDLVLPLDAIRQVGTLRPDMAHLLVNHPRGFEGFAEMVGPGTPEAWAAALLWLTGTAPLWLTQAGIDQLFGPEARPDSVPDSVQMVLL